MTDHCEPPRTLFVEARRVAALWKVPFDHVRPAGRGKESAMLKHGGLSLTRRALDRIELTTAAGETIHLTVLQIKGGVVKLHFAAPASVRILRSELAERSATEAA